MAVSTEHEQLLELFRDRKTLLAELLEPLGIELGDGEPEEASGDVTQAKPIIRAADLVLLHRRGGRLVMATAVEVQLERDADKPFRWPLYAATLRDRHRCPVSLVVVTPSRSVAEWAREPIELGTGSVFRVVVLGPDEIPRPTSPDESPERILLGVRAHPDLEAATVAFEASKRLHRTKQAEYIDALAALLPERERKEILEMVASYQRLYPQSDWAKEHFGRGLHEGHVEFLLKLLGSRFGDLPAETVERIKAADGDQLLVWGERVLTASSLEEVFAEPPASSE